MTSQFPANSLSAKDADLLNSFSLQLKVDALKAHINMHFLFNSLHTLSTLIDEDQEMSKSFLQKFSNVYQYLLCDHEHKIVPLTVEMDCIANYFFLYKTRFGININLDIQLPKTIRRFGIVPLTIITLSENAIKHNEISERDPLSISIFTHDGKVTEECMNKKNNQCYVYGYD